MQQCTMKQETVSRKAVLKLPPSSTVFSVSWCGGLSIILQKVTPLPRHDLLKYFWQKRSNRLLPFSLLHKLYIISMHVESYFIAWWRNWVRPLEHCYILQTLFETFCNISLAWWLYWLVQGTVRDTRSRSLAKSIGCNRSLNSSLPNGSWMKQLINAEI